MERGGSTYIMTNKNNTTLYVGVTSNLISRVYEHKTGFYKNSFTNRYNLNKLIYFENYHDIEEAIEREKQIKSWSRKKKEALIDSFNPDWIDLYETICKEWD